MPPNSNKCSKLQRCSKGVPSSQAPGRLEDAGVMEDFMSQKGKRKLTPWDQPPLLLAWVRGSPEEQGISQVRLAAGSIFFLDVFNPLLPHLGCMLHFCSALLIASAQAVWGAMEASGTGSLSSKGLSLGLPLCTVQCMLS